MKRRGLILVGTAAMIWRSHARAQQEPMPRIGLLSPVSLDEDRVTALRRGLRELGYVDGKNILLDVRSSRGDNDRLPELAAELASLKPVVIVSNGALAIRAVKDAAGSIPIVMAVIDDPVGLGFAQSLAHPGGNLTGQSNLAEGLVGKRIEMLLEVVPDPGCVAVLHDHGDQADDPLYWQEIFAAARTFHTVLKPIAVRSADELPAAFSQISREHCRAVMVMSSALYVGARVQLVALAAQHGVAASYDNRIIVDAGGLMSYGPDTRDMWRRAAIYVDKILKGAKPADLPIERPTKFDMVVNLKTAKALGLTIPFALLARADEVIE
jgi:putative tryptophan/tyrosine transport system substrate-binding protein